MSRPTRTGPTLATIARAAGVSVPTVSKVLNNRRDVSAATRRRVNETLDRHGYIRREPPRRRAGSPLFDVVVPGVGTSYAAAVLAGLEKGAAATGLDMVVSGVTARTRRGWLDRIADRGTNGVVLVHSEVTPAQLAWIDEHRIPLVVVDPITEPPERAGWVAAANREGGASVSNHLVGLGHERIAIVTGPLWTRAACARLDGFRVTMARAGLDVAPDHVKHGDFDQSSGYRAMVELLDSPRPPTAVFACSDLMALGAYEALLERGVRVPDDISVVGFDGLAETRWTAPPLTTVRQPLTDMASRAIAMLMTMAGRSVTPAPLELPTTLVLRDSTAPPVAALTNRSG